MWRRFLGLLGVVVVLLAGCTTPGPRDQDTAGPPDAGSSDPAAESRTYTPPAAAGGGLPRQEEETAETDGKPILLHRMVSRTGPGLGDDVAVPASSTVVVGSGPVTVNWVFSRPPHHDLPVRSTGPDPVHINRRNKLLQARFPAAEVPEWSVWLADIDGSRITFRRREEPTVTVGGVTETGVVTPLAGTRALLPPGPVTLDFAFDQPIDPESLQAVVEHSLRDAQDQRGNPFWLSPRQARWELPAMPTRLELALLYFRNADGLFAKPRALVLYNASETPYLERVAAGGGDGERIMSLPPDIRSARLATGGRFLALQTWDKRSETDPGLARRVQVADLGQHTVTDVALPPGELRWHPDGRLLAFGSHRPRFGPQQDDETGWASWRPGSAAPPVRHQGRLLVPAISPDGRWAAFLRPRWPRAPEPGQLYPMDLVLFELETGSERVVPDLVHTWSPGTEGDFRQHVAWSPDGRTVAALDPGDGPGQSDLVLYDLNADQRTVAVQAIPNLKGFGDPLRWSPDGEAILAGRKIVHLAEKTVTELPGWGPAAFWDAGGTRILTAMGEWDEVFVIPREGGQRTDLGPGLPLGWAGEQVYIIRWPGSHDRVLMGM